MPAAIVDQPPRKGPSSRHSRPPSCESGIGCADARGAGAIANNANANTKVREWRKRSCIGWLLGDTSQKAQRYSGNRAWRTTEATGFGQLESRLQRSYR